MKRIKKALASLAIAGMVLTLIPLNAFAEGAFPTRLAGWTAEQTAVAIADQTGWTGTAILASSSPYGLVDSLTAGPLATFLNAPILLTEAGNTLNPTTKAELTKLYIKKVYVTSGTAVISQVVLDEITSMGITVESLGGVDRFATSANIAQKMINLGATVSNAAVAYGWLYQDALSIAPIASARTGISITPIASAQTMPILLTEKNSLPASVKEFLTTNTAVNATDVIGGTGVIDDDVEAQLPSPTRHYGNTAYDTNLAVLKAFDSVLKYDHVFIANGETAIDALTGATLAAKYNACIVLTNGTLNEGTAYVRSKLFLTSIVTALGGSAVVSEGVLASTSTPSVIIPVITPNITPIITPNITPVITPNITPIITPSGGGGGGGGGDDNDNLTATLSSIAITTPATKLAYEVGDALDITGMGVTGTYSDTSTRIETITTANLTGFDSSAVDASQTLTVTVGGKTATYDITIAKADGPTLTGVVINYTATTVSGITSKMEFSINGTDWTPFNEVTPNLPNFFASHVALQVRVAATATHEAGIATKFSDTLIGTDPVNLGMAGNYAVLAKSGISSTSSSAIYGDVGISPAPATYITGFSILADTTNQFSTSTQITGKVYAPDYAPPTSSQLTTAISNMETAYTDAAGRAINYAGLYDGDISGRTLTPGIYKWDTGVAIHSDVTLNGGANDVWIFQIAQGITQASNTKIILTGGAQAKNIFWQAAETVAIGTDAHFEGIILGQTNIALGTKASINGRLLAQTAVTLDKSTVIAPSTVTLRTATATGNFGNAANINEMMTALFATGDSTVQGIAIKPVFRVDVTTNGALIINGDNVSEGLLQWINTQWGGSSIPVAISFSSGTPAAKTTDANWDNCYTVWVDLGALAAGRTSVDVPMTNGTKATYTVTVEMGN